MSQLIVMKKVKATDDIPKDIATLVADVDDPGMIAGYWRDRCLGVALPDREAILFTVSGGMAVAVVTTHDRYDILELIVVGKGSRGSGVGSKIIVAIAAYHDDRPLLLEVHVDNHRAITLYRRLGMRMMDRRGDYIVMKMSGHLRRAKKIDHRCLLMNGGIHR
jgi:ribosomal protein S18 acetylase RimI-like enzyme